MIIIPTHISRINTWLSDCLASIDTQHQVMVLFQGEKPTKRVKIGFEYTHQELNGYDPGAVVWAMKNLQPTDEFMVLHDSCVVKDNKLFDVLFSGYYEDSVALSNHPTLMGMFLGKYRMQVALQLEPPIAKDKMHAVDLEETWNRSYCALEQPILMEQPLTTSNIFVEKHGRQNMVLGNRWIKKYKGAWSRNQI